MKKNELDMFCMFRVFMMRSGHMVIRPYVMIVIDSGRCTISRTAKAPEE